jgi:8-oxo-dGTP pyrophosphatase MutT (NUDIX family)
MAETLNPRPAATVLTLRDAPNGYEILMVRRNVRSEFMGGVFVFPGGALDDDDQAVPVFGLDDEGASLRLGLTQGGLGYHVAALRELFEEAGLLVVCDEQGRDVLYDDAAERARLDAYRSALNADETTLSEVVRAEGVCLDLRRIEYLAHWITPVVMPRRYDTRFFVVQAPEGQRASHDQGETTDLRWLRPGDALIAHERGEIEMVMPTIRNLQAIAPYSTAQEVLTFASTQEGIEAVHPRALQRDGELVILLPGDEGYDDVSS